ncbi:transposase, partial [Flavobacterium covae]
KDKIVDLPEDYYFSSARNYAGLENDLEVILLYLF